MAKTVSLARIAYSRKCRVRKKLYTKVKDKTKKQKRKKERTDHKCPVAKKERPNHKCWWQTKNGCPNQASKQLTSNERNKTAEITSKPQTVAYLQAYSGEKNTHKNTPPNHNSLIDYCLQQRSGRLKT